MDSFRFLPRHFGTGRSSVWPRVPPASDGASSDKPQHFLASPEFLATADPFGTPQYQALGFPLPIAPVVSPGTVYESVKAMADENKTYRRPIHGSRNFKMGMQGWLDGGFSSFMATGGFEINQGLAAFNDTSYPFLKDNISVIAASDFAQCGQPLVRVHYLIDGRQLSRGMAHRGDRTGEARHRDNKYGDEATLALRLKYLRAANDPNSFQGLGYREIGLPRSYGYVIARDPEGRTVECATQFYDHGGNPVPAKNDIIYEWMAEPHDSLPVPDDCFRIFFRANLTPVELRAPG